MNISKGIDTIKTSISNFIQHYQYWISERKGKEDISKTIKAANPKETDVFDEPILKVYKNDNIKTTSNLITPEPEPEIITNSILSEIVKETIIEITQNPEPVKEIIKDNVNAPKKPKGKNPKKSSPKKSKK